MSKVYQIITDRIIELLEKGTVPWHVPWRGSEGAPKSLVSGKDYRGINVFSLVSAGYEAPWWLSFKQTKERGGNVKKGEKGWPCIYWNWLEKEDLKTKEKQKIGFIKYYTVFNVEQTEGVEYPKHEITYEFTPIQKCEEIIEGMQNPPEIRKTATNPQYDITKDLITIPREELFSSPEEFYATLYHELTHATGHKKRLNRPEFMNNSSFGSRSYSKEELVGEMGASFLCGHAGIENKIIDNSASYIDGWLSKLQKDKKILIQSASLAQKASDYILGKNFDEER